MGIPTNRITVTGLSAGLLLSLLAACATAPVRPVTGYSPTAGDKAARTAQAMIGRPYKFKGDTPEGFDCSGLVRYNYLSAGMNVPHSTRALRNSTRSIGLRNARKGDLIFFNEKGGPYSHVGIYEGNNQFVHAPSTGERVRKDSLLDPYWKRHFIDARRFP